MKVFFLITKCIFPSGLVLLTSFLLITAKAHAGGSDDPYLSEEERASRVISMPSVLSWDKWENPYISGNSLCRRKNGDVICLPSEMAKKVGANILAPKKPQTLQTIKRQ
ncbi:hypothetical protein I8752_01700 [Nostocaceae cyanobacterium CENA369]|uniref:Uncharacterized protein n=1 Tax=Dendronalium phyllosphericum CENA369 TaxID=1725256 RepID=A0A8J7I2K1_9NOST|nr:hypothetical protein [Dendronalium phyllosphericum]MBH8571761.1 hypothetical protein [Dendronalium phyllosphericum CENA369]